MCVFRRVSVSYGLLFEHAPSYPILGPFFSFVLHNNVFISCLIGAELFVSPLYRGLRVVVTSCLVFS